MTRSKALSMRTSQPGVAHEAAQASCARLRDTLNSRHRQHHARVGAPPQHRLAGAEPREDAVAVGLLQALRRQPAAGRQQARRVAVRAQRQPRGRQRVVVVDPGQHLHARTMAASAGPARPDAKCLTSKALTSKLLPCSMVPGATTHEDRLHRRRPGRAVLRAADEAARPAPRHHRGRAQQALRHLRLGRGVLRRRRWTTCASGTRPPRPRSSRPSTTGTTSSSSSRAARIRSGGHGFVGIGRKKLLNILQARCEAAGREAACSRPRSIPTPTSPTPT